jgi:hypothetical protein
LLERREDMSCEKCKIAQDVEKREYYFRWKNANILLSGCEEHIKEIMDILRKVQRTNSQ